MINHAHRVVLLIGMLTSACSSAAPITESTDIPSEQPTDSTDAPSTQPSTDTPQPTDPPSLPIGRLAFEMHFDVGLSELLIVDLDCDPDTRICQRTPVPFLCQPLNGSSPAWSPDGSQIAFSSTQDGDSEIYLAPYDGIGNLPICPPDLTQLTTNDSEDITPVWSPDSSRIAFASNRSGSFNLYVMDSDGSNLTPLTADGDFHAAPTWSPDSTQIAFETRFANNRSSIFVIDTNGENLTLLSDPDENTSDPAWSPDGTQIAFVSDRDGNFDIFVTDFDDGSVLPVTRSPRFDGAPAWSSDGRFLAFTSHRRDSIDIYLVPSVCLYAPTPCDDQAFLLWDNLLIESAPAWQPTP